jgi:hypothetical protein
LRFSDVLFITLLCRLPATTRGNWSTNIEAPFYVPVKNNNIYEIDINRTTNQDDLALDVVVDIWIMTILPQVLIIMNPFLCIWYIYVIHVSEKWERLKMKCDS